MLVAQATVKGHASVDGSEFFPDGMDGPTVNHAGQELIPGERTGDQPEEEQGETSLA